MATQLMMRARFVVLLFAVFSPLLAEPIAAQNYRFTVEQMDLEAFVQPDASVQLKYTIVFKNAAGAHPIDIVDIGLPHSDYNLSNMKASVDGQPVYGIRKSTYIDIGVEVPLGNRMIQPGQTGKFEFQCTMPDMVYRDTTDKTRASLQIKPTWFDPTLQMGRSRLQVAIHLPPETQPDQVTYQEEKHKYDDLVLYGEGEEKHVVAIWSYDSVMLSSNNPKFSVSFPQSGMDRVVSLGPFGLFMKWFRESSDAQVFSIIGVIILFTYTFFRFSHGTGFVLYFILAGVIAFIAFNSPGLNLAFWPGVVTLMTLNERYLGRRKRTYLPAMATVEGGGIKRGLTAPQAAVLLELPLGKILALVVFGLLKKGVIRQIQSDPLEVTLSPDYMKPRKNRMLQAAGDGIVLHDYEHAFLDRIAAHKGLVKDCDFNEAMGGLVKSVAQRMKGFDLDETKTYYQAIVKRAWVEAESVGELEQRTTVLDRNYEWILLDDNWGSLFDTWSGRGYHYRPRWERAGGFGGSGTARSTPTTPSASQTSFGEVAGSFAGWAENTMGGFASAVEPAKLGLNLPKGGVLDLSGVDRTTANVFQALMESSSSGRGGGGGCACAGCACACACAGGGR